jgi:hypothetical protein
MEVETAVTPGHVSNAQFMRDVMGPLAAGEYAWACHFAAPPNSALAEWGGFRVSEYAQVEDYKVNAYCSVAIVSDRRQGRHFIRMTCVVLDDSQPDPHASWVLETSPGNYQVGYIIWPAITDEGVASRLQKALSEQGLVKADQSGYSSVRYVRLPVGCNTKVSPPYPHRLLDWQPECIFTLDDLIEKFDLDADEILNPQTRIAPAQGAPSAPFADRRFTSEDSEYVRSIVMGDMYHDSLLALSARYVARGMPPAQVTEALRGMMQAREVRDDRWQARLEEIPRLVRGAAEKFTPTDPGAATQGEGLSAQALVPIDEGSTGPIATVIKGVLPADGLGILWAPPASFKSFLAFDWALSVASGVPWLGKQTIKGEAWFIAGEGNAGLAKRMRAWRRERDFDGPVNLLHSRNAIIIDGQPGERSLGLLQLLGMIDKGHRPSLIVIDTLSRSMSGDESSTLDSARYIAAIGELQAAMRAVGHQCCIILVHHARKAGDALRGSSTLLGAADFVYKIERNGSAMDIAVHCDKWKDDSTPESHYLEARVVDLGIQQDNHGDMVQVTSLVLWVKSKEAAERERQTALRNEAEINAGKITAILAKTGPLSRSQLLAEIQNTGQGMRKVEFLALVNDMIRVGRLASKGTGAASRVDILPNF